MAPVVAHGAEAGDAVAVRLIEAAAGHLEGSAVAAAGDEAPAVVVLAGSLLTRVPPVGHRVGPDW